MANEHFVSQEGLDKLKNELATLKQRRREIADRIAEAIKLGDLSENAEYHEAKDDQGLNEARMAELEDLIHRSVVIADQKKRKGAEINIGSTIVIQNGGGKKEYTIVGSSEANPSQGLISNESPLGKAFMGRKAGETIKFEAPSGPLTYTILEIK